MKLLLTAIAFFTLFFSCMTAVEGQVSSLSLIGKTLNRPDGAPLAGVNLVLKKNGRVVGATISDPSGSFRFNKLSEDSFVLISNYLGYKEDIKHIHLDQTKTIVVFMNPDQNKLKEFTVQGQQIRTEIKGDTTVINAAAFKVNPDATSEDLVKKMPGIQITNGTVTAQGENVKRVLLDGKEFFGDDASAALKNMPAEIVDKVQVFNKLSDQAQFSGFNDGNTDKVMNITTLNGRANGVFGKMYAGYGTDDHYQAGASMNFFNGARRVTLLGLTNNINVQNFTAQDIFGSGGGGGGGGFGGMGGMRGGGGQQRGGPQQNGALNNFLVGQQSGLNTTNSFGVNYINKWGKLNVSTSYFFNEGINTVTKTLNRQYLISKSANQVYDEKSYSQTTTQNHRINLRMEYNFDTSNSLLYTPRFSFQNTNSISTLDGINSILNKRISSTINNYDANNNGYSLSNNLLYRHKFAKFGRTISTNLGLDVNDKFSTNNQYSATLSQDTSTGSSNLNQRTRQTVSTINPNLNITYTEPLGARAQLLVSYAPSLSQNYTIKDTRQFDSSELRFKTRDTALSNEFYNSVTIHRAMLNYNLRGDKFNLMFGVTQQFVGLNTDERFPLTQQVNRNYINTLPNATFQYQFDKQRSIRTFYRTSTNVPSISQLQNVVDNSNPLILNTGNPLLKQEYVHTLMMRFNKNKVEKNRSLFLFIMGNYTQNYIANTTFIAARDTVLYSDSIHIAKGSQLTRPDNLNANMSLRSFLTYGLPVTFLKSNLNLNFGLNYTSTPGIVNFQRNDARTINVTGGFVLGSNISPAIDFNVNYTGNYNSIVNTLQTSANSNYFVHTAGFKINYMPTQHWVISSDFNYSKYQGLGSGFDQAFALWNAAIGYKFLPKNAMELRFSVFDLLDQNNSITRTVTETYIETSRTKVLQRYFMLTLTYNIRKFRFN